MTANGMFSCVITKRLALFSDTELQFHIASAMGAKNFISIILMDDYP
jgi:hypothetical protein